MMYTRYELKFTIEGARKIHEYYAQESLLDAFVEWQSKGAIDMECFEITEKDITEHIQELEYYDRR